jgi:hypothetical protein
MKQYNDILYKTSSKEVGKTAHLAMKKKDFGHNGKFSKVSSLLKRYSYALAFTIFWDA